MKLVRAFLYCLIIPSLAACLSSPSDNFDEKGEILYQDDFSNPGTQLEKTTADSTSMVVEGGLIISITSTFYQTWALLGDIYKNVQIEVDATRLTGPESNLFGILCRASASGDFYVFMISSDGYYAIGKSLKNIITQSWPGDDGFQ